MDGADRAAAAASTVRREADAPERLGRREHDRAVLRPLLGTVVHASPTRATRGRSPTTGGTSRTRRRPRPPSTAWTRCSPAGTSGPTCSPATGSSSSTTGAAGGRSRRACATDWDSIPFDRVDAAFVGNDGKTYVFRGGRVRPLLRRRLHPGRRPVPEGDHGLLGQRRQPHHPHRARRRRARRAVARRRSRAAPERTHTYLFSGRPVRPVRGHRLRRPSTTATRATSPRRCATEPRFANLTVALDSGIDAAVADRRTVYLFTGGALPRRVRSPLPQLRRTSPCAARGCAFLEDGAVLVEDEAGWRRFTRARGRGRREDPGAAADPARRPGALPHRPRRRAGRRRRQHLPVQGPRPATTSALGREFPTAEDWGRPRNTIADGEGVDAAFVGPRREDLRVQRRPVRHLLRDGLRRRRGRRAPPAGRRALGRPHRRRAWPTSTTASPTCSSRRTPSGNRRYVVYSGSDYTRPDPGYPQVAGPDFWGVPPEYRGAEPFPVAVLFDRDNTLYLAATQYVAAQRGVRRLVLPAAARAAVAGPAAGHRVRTAADRVHRRRRRDVLLLPRRVHPLRRRRVLPARADPRARWGRIRNTITSAGRATAVDAAFVWRGDDDLPVLRRPVRPLLRRRATATSTPATRSRSSTTCAHEECFAQPAGGVRADAGRPGRGGRADGDRRRPGQRRTVYLFVGRFLPRRVPERSRPPTTWPGSAASATTSRTPAGWTRRSSRGEHTFLFSGDQYVRYSGAEYDVRRRGLPAHASPRRLPGEVGVDALPEEFHDGLDAALPDAERPGVPVPRAPVRGHRASARRSPQPIAGTWGTVRNLFVADPYDARRSTRPSSPATASLFAFKGDQYLRYRRPTAERRRRRLPADDQGRLGEPPDRRSRRGSTPPSSSRATTYFVRGEQYVRYSGDDFRRIDRTYPQPLVAPLGPVGGLPAHRPARHLPVQAAAGPTSDGHGGLAAVLSSDGRHGGPVRPARRAVRLGRRRADVGQAPPRRSCPRAPGYEVEFDLELVEAAVDLFALAAPLGGAPSTVYTDVWTPLYRTPTRPRRTARGRAADALRRLLALRYARGGVDGDRARRCTTSSTWPRATRWWRPCSRSRADLQTSRDLFDRLFIDVDMGSAATTSRVREAIAAAQLFFHRYLLDLQPVTLRPRRRRLPPARTRSRPSCGAGGTG